MTNQEWIESIKHRRSENKSWTDVQMSVIYYFEKYLSGTAALCVTYVKLL